ncbi:MAG: hypothetical protein PHH09_08540 [Methanoregulaceae archaeon]|nr:hypothetical protein [Methanoregulaceae archaeon]
MSEDGFSVIIDDLRNISGEITVLSSRFEMVDDKVDEIASDLHELSTQFHSFLDTYSQNTELQLAETRINTVRQRIEKEYGHYAEVRRHTTGILQAVDTGLVRQGTIRAAAENLMLSTPRYWLTPCLIALSAWIDDDKNRAESAKLEAIRRNDERASLFFSLVNRRANQYDASRTWLDRYLGMQDPSSLPPDMVVVVDAYANGIFGPDVDGLCLNRFQQWLVNSSNEEGFEEEQKNQWKSALLSVHRDRVSDRESYLEKYSPTYPQLVDALSGACIHTSLLDYFSTIFEEKDEPVDEIVSAVDGMLDTLVTEYDEEERDLKNEERFLALIIEEGGDRKEASRRIGLSQPAGPVTMDFTQVLTNAALHPSVYTTSLTCRKFAVAMSRDWIINAYKEITAENRQLVPHEIEFKIDSWSGSTVDGGNENELTESIQHHIDKEITRALADTRLDAPMVIPGLVGGAILIWGLSALNVVGIVIGAIGVGWLYYQYSKMAQKKYQVKAHFTKVASDMKNIVRAMLAEIVDWRSAYADEDAHAQRVDTLLELITPEQYVGRFSPSEKAMSTQVGGVKSPAAIPGEDQGLSLASQYPPWDLRPPLINTRRKSA